MDAVLFGMEFQGHINFPMTSVLGHCRVVGNCMWLHHKVDVAVDEAAAAVTHSGLDNSLLPVDTDFLEATVAHSLHRLPLQLDNFFGLRLNSDVLVSYRTLPYLKRKS